MKLVGLKMFGRLIGWFENISNCINVRFVSIVYRPMLSISKLTYFK